MDTAQQIFKKIIELSKDIEKVGVDLKPILPAIAEIFATSIDTNIIEHGRWNGNKSNIGLFSGGSQKWEPLAESTKKGYRKKGISNLQRTLNRHAGGLRSSIEIKPLGLSRLVFGMSGGESSAGVNPKVYAGIQNFGGRYTKEVAVRSHKRKIKSAFGIKLSKARTVTVAAFNRRMNVNIPASPFMVLQKEDLDSAFEMLTDYLEKQLKKI